MRLLLFTALLVPVVAAQTQPLPYSPYLTQSGLPFSAESQALSDAGAFGHAEDPVRMLHNPAILGGLGDGLRLSGTLSPDLNGFGGIDTGGGDDAVGFRTEARGRPLTVVVGLATGTIDYGTILSSSSESPDPVESTSEAEELAVALGMGAGWDGPLHVRAGVAVRSLSSPDFVSLVEDPERALVADLGLDVTAPISQWLQPEPLPSGLRAVYNVTAGYALRGVELSNEPIVYEDFTSGPPELQRVSGGALLLGLDLEARTTPIRAASIEGFLDYQTGNFQSRPGITRTGARLTVLDALSVSTGTLRGGDYLARSTFGVGLSVGGIVRALGALTDDARLYATGQRFDVRYDYATQSFNDEERPFGESDTHGLVLRYRL